MAKGYALESYFDNFENVDSGNGLAHNMRIIIDYHECKESLRDNSAVPSYNLGMGSRCCSMNTEQTQTSLKPINTAHVSKMIETEGRGATIF